MSQADLNLSRQWDDFSANTHTHTHTPKQTHLLDAIRDDDDDMSQIVVITAVGKNNLLCWCLRTKRIHSYCGADGLFQD